MTVDDKLAQIFFGFFAKHRASFQGPDKLNSDFLKHLWGFLKENKKLLIEYLEQGENK